LRSFF
jgi:hypothetical protein